MPFLHILRAPTNNRELTGVSPAACALRYLRCRHCDHTCGTRVIGEANSKGRDQQPPLAWRCKYLVWYRGLLSYLGIGLLENGPGRQTVGSEC